MTKRELTIAIKVLKELEKFDQGSYSRPISVARARCEYLRMLKNKQ